MNWDLGFRNWDFSGKGILGFKKKSFKVYGREGFFMLGV